MARLLATPFRLPEWNNIDYRADPRTWPDHAWLEVKLKETADLPEGEVVGALLQWPRGDGYAYYLVVKERPLTLQWVSIMDAWYVEDALIRGLNKADVLEKIDQKRRLAAFIQKRKEA